MESEIAKISNHECFYNPKHYLRVKKILTAEIRLTKELCKKIIDYTFLVKQVDFLIFIFNYFDQNDWTKCKEITLRALEEGDKLLENLPENFFKYSIREIATFKEHHGALVSAAKYSCLNKSDFKDYFLRDDPTIISVPEFVAGAKIATADNYYCRIGIERLGMFFGNLSDDQLMTAIELFFDLPHEINHRDVTQISINAKLSQKHKTAKLLMKRAIKIKKWRKKMIGKILKYNEI